jgi:S-adenosylmethionine hydrolase
MRLKLSPNCKLTILIMIILFTDFGSDDIYVAQMKATLIRSVGTEVPILDLLHNAPNFNITASAHLLAALQFSFPTDSVFLSIIDPGVGGVRKPVVVEANGKYFVGPDNGLLSIIANRANSASLWQIDWRPETLSTSFHGRDLFAPIAADIVIENGLSSKLSRLSSLDVTLDSGDLYEIIYIDHYGNALTGIRTDKIPKTAALQINDITLSYCEVFSKAPLNEAFWYTNSIGLVEIAVNQGNAQNHLHLELHDKIKII